MGDCYRDLAVFPRYTDCKVDKIAWIPLFMQQNHIILRFEISSEVFPMYTDVLFWICLKIGDFWPP